MMIRIHKYIVILIFVITNSAAISQQQKKYLVSPSGDTVQINAISILDLSSKVLDFNSNQKLYDEKLKTYKEVYEIDTSLIRAKDYLLNKKQLLDENADKLTLVKIENANREWQNYESILKDWESTINTRITDLENTLFKVQVEQKTWELTKNSGKEQAIPKESLKRINEVLTDINKLESAIKAKQDSILNTQTKVTDFQILVNEVLNSFDKQKKELQSDYFIQDSPPIWKSSDSTMRFKNAKAQFKASLEEHKKAVELFTSSNSSQLIWHLLVFVFLLGLFFYLNKDFNKQNIPADKNGQALKYFLSRYFLSSLLLATSLAIYIYSNIPATIREAMLALLLFPTILLYNGLFPKKLHQYLLLLVALFLIDEMHMFFISKTFITRMLMLIQDSIFLYIMFSLVRKNSPIIGIFKESWIKGIKRIGNILIFFAITSMLANIIGFVNLSIILSNTLVSTVIVPLILSLLVYIFDALIISLFKTKSFQNSNIIRLYGDNLAKKIHSILVYLTIFLWVRSIFLSLGIADEVGDWLLGLMNNEWKVGSVNISFGGIIVFFLVIIITYLLTKGVKYLLEDEIFPRIKLGRGVPGAISMVIRYTIVAFGIYVALSAAGVDLGQFGLIAGALGVGIGFGLQGIVYNFIAGLILAFERPVQKGDTIQVGTVFGDVKEIGVRASKIQTYDGSTIIIPNGNLISNELTNWTFSKRIRRREIKVGVAYGSNPRDVMDLLFKVADENEKVLPFPKPWSIFEGFGDSSLNFAIRFWVNFDQGVTIQSEVAMEIYDALDDAGIRIPFPQTDLHVKSFDPTIQKTVFPFIKDQSKKTTGKKPVQPKNEEDKE